MKLPCPYCGAMNEDPRRWDARERVCPACEDRELDHEAAAARPVLAPSQPTHEERT